MGNDGFFGIGISELVMIAVIALVVLGPERLPATMRSVAKFIRQVQGMYNELTSQFSDELKPFQDLHPQKLLQELTASLTEDEVAQPTAAGAPPAVAKTNTPKPVVATTKAADVNAAPVASVSGTAAASPTAIEAIAAVPAAEQSPLPEHALEPVVDSIVEGK